MADKAANEKLALDVHARHVVSHDKFSRIATAYGNVVVEIRAEREPHGAGYGSRPVSGHVTRSRAIALVKEQLPAEWKVNAHTGEFTMDNDLFRVYTVVRVA